MTFQSVLLLLSFISAMHAFQAALPSLPEQFQAVGIGRENYGDPPQSGKISMVVDMINSRVKAVTSRPEGM